MIEIKTDKLVLKKPQHKDKPLLVSQIGDWEVAKWLSRVPHPYSADDAELWLKKVSQEELSFNIFKNDSLIGGVGLTQEEDGFYELGFWLGREHWGQGFAIEVSQADCALLRRVDAIYLDEIRRAGLYDEIWQAFAVLLPVRSVGVMGDARAYDRVCGLRAVTSRDGMTADIYEFPAGFLGSLAARIVNEVPGIGRVVYDITSKPPSSIEWE